MLAASAGTSADVGVTKIACAAEEVDVADTREALSTWQTYLKDFEVTSRRSSSQGPTLCSSA